MRKYIDLKEVYSKHLQEPLVSENYSIEYASFSPENLAEFEKNNKDIWLYEGLVAYFPYVCLVKDKKYTMMSDVPMEKATNQNFLNNANGNVLIGGLGIGLIIFPLLNDESIKSITVVELDKGLIDIVGPIIKEYDINNKVKIINADIFQSINDFEDSSLDAIYFDIWPRIIGENFPEMEKLNSLYECKLNKENDNSFMDSWCYDHCEKAFKG